MPQYPRKLPLANIPKTLPCVTCPHEAICCSWGSSVDEREEKAIRAVHGDAALVWCEEDKEWRTSVVNGRCFFLRNALCSIHEEPYYPAVCKGFPWTNGRGEPYLYDTSICPEIPQEEEEAKDPAPAS